MRRIVKLLVTLLLTAVLPLEAPAAEGIISLSTGKSATFSSVVTQAIGAGEIFVGEAHDNPAHHALQLDMIRALHAQKVPLAIGLEMFQADNQQALDDWVAGKISEENFVAIYSRNWSFDWSLYRDIFVFARENRIPLVGLNLPKEIVTRASRNGFNQLSQEDKARLPAGITCEMTPRYVETLKTIYNALPRRLDTRNRLTLFSEAQALRNNGMAAHVRGYLERNPQRKMIVLAGFWHAVKSGTPAQVDKHAKRPSLVVLPELPEFGTGNATAQDADFLVRQ